MLHEENWNYFKQDLEYTDVLNNRLVDKVEMVSAHGLVEVMNNYTNSSLSLLDLGSGPGHYFPVIDNNYNGKIYSYHGVDIVRQNVENGNDYFASNDRVKFSEGDVMRPRGIYNDESCIVSANTLPHVPSIAPLMNFISTTRSIECFFFRLLLGSECVQIKKHLKSDSFDNLFEENYQHNNIYSLDYFRSLLDDSWSLDVYPDRIDQKMLENHSIPKEKENSFYSNRVSRFVNGSIFKGEVHMPWKYIVGIRNK